MKKFDGLKKFVRYAAAGLGIVLLVLAIVVSIPLDPTVPALEARPSTEYWTMDSGYRLAYTHVPAATPRDAPPVIYLHGGPGGFVSSSAIEDLGRLAEHGYDVYLYDQVGSGLSDRLEKPKDYSFHGHVADLREIITAKIGAEQAILIGQSFGGQLISYFVARHPELVGKAVLTSPGAIEPSRFDDEGNWINARLYPVPDSLEFVDPPDVSEEMKVRSWPPRFIATVALATAFDIKLMPDDEADAALNTVVTKITPGMVCDPDAVPDFDAGLGMGAYSHGFSNWFADVDDWRAELREASVPLLVLQGQCDVFSYATVYEHAALAPRGTYRFIEGAGHRIRWERPDVYFEEILRFLERPAE